MHTRSHLAAALVLITCLVVIGHQVFPGAAAPAGGLPALNTAESTPTATPLSAIFLPVITAGFTFTTPPTATPSPTATPTPTPTPIPPCTMPARIDANIVITVSPDLRSPLEQRVGKVPFVVALAAGARGGVPPYSFCWDLEPDGRQDTDSPNPVIVLSRPGVYQPLLVVIDSTGSGQYVGVPPTGVMFGR